jgi:methionyl aminopeptidase
MIHIKSPPELSRMRVAGRHVGEILLLLREHAAPGVTTGELDALARKEIAARGLTSSFLGYAPGDMPPYPAVLCASINDEIVHGIPSRRVLERGDLLKLDFGAICDGFHGDSAVALVVGGAEAATSSVKSVMDVTRASMYAGIEQMVPGKRLYDISHAVQQTVEAAGFSVVKDFVGHGIGRAMHEAPKLPNFGKPNRGDRLRAGMVIAIEPMVNVGGHKVTMLSDGWTATTADGSLSCHYEHTVAITDDGPEILTRVPGGH